MSINRATTVWRTGKELLARCFANYVWLGLSLILVAIVIDAEWSKESIFIKIGVDMLSTVGIAVLVAAVFSFAAGTSDFLKGSDKTYWHGICAWLA